MPGSVPCPVPPRSLDQRQRFELKPCSKVSSRRQQEWWRSSRSSTPSATTSRTSTRTGTSPSASASKTSSTTRSTRPAPKRLQAEAPRRASSGAAATQGALKETGNPLDLAIEGEGFLQLRRTDGSTVLTRDGALQLNANGELSDAAGNALEPADQSPRRRERLGTADLQRRHDQRARETARPDLARHRRRDRQADTEGAACSRRTPPAARPTRLPDTSTRARSRTRTSTSGAT